MKWVCLVVAPNEPIAESWAELLRQHGMPAYVRTETISTLIAGPSKPVHLMVPDERAAEGKALFDTLIGPWEWQPADS